MYYNKGKKSDITYLCGYIFSQQLPNTRS
ncbi:hypothetical protein ZEAMMB73_Zm00001d016954 [Zea mays]|uniref:Uncharacterized protein n=1 Tax=Zea mays TaxID=4577 RepID=A0A1D6HBE6_MAIZE|nr:hypothetical protein ZEAMMB73_Zm00001d016954 [Zea mays]